LKNYKTPEQICLCFALFLAIICTKYTNKQALIFLDVVVFQPNNWIALRKFTLILVLLMNY